MHVLHLSVYRLSLIQPTFNNRHVPCKHSEDVNFGRYVARLRIWISETILTRLVDEIDFIDKELNCRGYSHIKVGGVGLQRLMRIAEHQLKAITSVSMVISFLKISQNQRYLVQRIREMAKGSSINMEWNLDNSIWDERELSDSMVIFYLDSVLRMKYIKHNTIFMPRYPNICR